MQEHVHQAQTACIGDDLVAVKRLVLQERLLVPVQVEVVRVGNEVVGGEKETACTAGRVGDERARFGADAFDHSADEGTRREILACAGLGIFGVLLKKSFVNISFYVGTHGDPFGVVHHVDEAEQLCRVLDLVQGLGEDLAQHTSRLGPKLAKQGDVVGFELRTSPRLQALPVEFGWDTNIAVVWRFGILVGHLEEDQIGELFQVVAIAHPVIAQGSAEAPDFGDDGERYSCGGISCLESHSQSLAAGSSAIALVATLRFVRGGSFQSDRP